MVRCGFRRGSGLGLWSLAFVFAQAGGCDTFANGYDEAPQGFGGTTGFPKGGAGSFSFGGTIAPPPAGTGGGLCPPGGTGGSFVIDAGMNGGPGGEGGKAGGRSGAGGEGGVNGASGETGTIGEGGLAGAGMTGGAGMSGEAGATGSGGDGGAPATNGCPADEPEVGPCADEGRECAYGNPINLTCRKLWTCFNGLWSSSRPCTPEQEQACPAESPPHGSACTERVTCGYPDGNTCECSSCGIATCWQCNQAPMRPPGCPQELPLAGASCSVQPVECNYGECLSGMEPLTAVCCHGAWIVRSQSCPPPI